MKQAIKEVIQANNIIMEDLANDKKKLHYDIVIGMFKALNDELEQIIYNHEEPISNTFRENLICSIIGGLSTDLSFTLYAPDKITKIAIKQADEVIKQLGGRDE